MQFISDSNTDLIHLIFAYTFLLRDTQISKYLSASPVSRLISHPGDNVEMYMRMIFVFSKLDHICFHASDYSLKRQGNTPNQRPQFSGFLLSELIKRFDVSLQNQHQPSRQ